TYSPPLPIYLFDRKEEYPTKQKAITEVTAPEGEEREQMAISISSSLCYSRYSQSSRLYSVESAT
ncbi:hypothetical protein, partial [Bacillus mycoides]|uniref:hypothetical protein n=1 Tax=Bacillus mycoides TaxID=1405 RepID=UPI0019D6AF2F